MSASTTTPRPIWVKPLAGGSVDGAPSLLFDWEFLGREYTALRFVMINTGAGALSVTPEAAYKSDGPAESGAQAPLAFSVPAGACYGDPYGIDEMRPYWRMWVSGTSSFQWGILGIPR